MRPGRSYAHVMGAEVIEVLVMKRSSFRTLTVGLFTSLALLLAAVGQAQAATAAEIDAKVAHALAQFRKEVSEADGFLDVAAFAFGREGLMAGWSAKGTKFDRVKPD